MSNRREQFGTSVKNPAQRYYTWSSEAKCFRYYDKETGTKNVEVFPLQFTYLTSRSTVGGWHDATESGIYANEVINSKEEEMVVYSYKPNKSGNTLIAKGLYKEIKGNLEGGHFEKVIYGYQEGVGIIKINLKGSGSMAYSDFTKLNKNLFDNVIVVDEFGTGKKGKVTYHTPTFKLGEKVSPELDKATNIAFTEVEDYFKAKAAQNSNNNENNTEQEEYNTGVDPAEVSIPQMATAGDEDDLPF